MHVGRETRALVTGASRGIGRATAEALSARGATVGLVARSEDQLRSLAEQLPAAAHVLPADVTDVGSIAGAIRSFVEAAGGVDVVVANAGVANYGPFLERPLDELEAMVSVNVLGTLYTVRPALEAMTDAGFGHLVVVSSGAGLRAFPQAAVYGATKAFDRGLAEALRHELSGTGVSVTTVFPGEFESDLHGHQRERLPDWRSNDEELPASKLARAIVAAVEDDQRELHLPRIVRLLGLNGLAPGLTDRALRQIRGPSAAPRVD